MTPALGQGGQNLHLPGPIGRTHPELDPAVLGLAKESLVGVQLELEVSDIELWDGAVREVFKLFGSSAESDARFIGREEASDLETCALLGRRDPDFNAVSVVRVDGARTVLGLCKGLEGVIRHLLPRLTCVSCGLHGLCVTNLSACWGGKKIVLHGQNGTSESSMSSKPDVGFAAA
jgi:hypothetical protein